MNHHIGDYNGIYFLEGAGGIVGVCDRAHRKDVVGFAEDGLIDLATPPRPESKHIIGGVLPGRDGGPAVHMYMPDGFGRKLSYTSLDRDEPDVLAARLTIGLPDRSLYRVRWQAVARDEDTFTLAGGISLTVSTSLPWAYQDSLLQVQTGDQPGEITFVVESRTPPRRVRDLAIIACAGHEREAIMARSRCGPGFVPCFVLPPRQWSAHQAAPGEVLLGPGAPDFDALPAGAPTLTAPDREEAYGPALALAVAHGARLVLTGQDDVIRLTGTAPREWRLGELLTSPLGVFGTGPETVVAESTAAELLVCQAVGYASMRQCGIAFIPPVSGRSGASAATLARECATAVPPPLRELDADVLTIFTRALPLHLTPLPDGRRWLDRHRIAHLPGQVSSMLLSRPPEPAPRLLFGVVFDALSAFTATEGRVYRDKLAGGLSYPLLLSRRDARREVLQEVLGRVEVDLLMLIAHGEDDHFEDAHNDPIPAGLIRTWRLRGQPVVFNNSCSSWTGTGEAFLAAGARAVIGTLWPVSNDVAARIGAGIGERSHDENVVTLLHDAVRTVADPDAAAYVYVGLPDTRLQSRSSLDEEETLAVLTEAMDQLYRCLNELAGEGRTEVALALHKATVPALREQFGALAMPGRLPPHLPPPKAQASVLDIGYLLATASLTFLSTLLPGTAPERTGAVLGEMCGLLETAYRELTTWDERHRAHLGRADTTTSDSSRVLLAALFTGQGVLPAVSLLADFGDVEQARRWLAAAVELMGGSDDETVVQRIRAGITVQSVDLLAEAVDKAVLAYRFGEAKEKLGETARAVTFYEAALDLAEAGSAAETQAHARLRVLRPEEDDILGRHVAAFEKARRGGDSHASRTAAADMLRYAAENRRTLPGPTVRQALNLDAPRESSHHWVSHRLNILGAAMTYYAAQDDADGIDAVREEVFGYLGACESTAVVPLNELAAWYYRNGDYPAAIETGLDLGARLQQARCADAAARLFCFTARVILRAYQARAEPDLLTRFFDVSGTIGRILRDHAGLPGALADQMADVRTETESIWRQIAARNDWRLASRGYAAYTRWPGTRRSPGWELLSKALHPRNIEAVGNLAFSGGLTRDAQVRIGADRTVDMATTTHRPGRAGPDTVYGLCPLHGGAAELRGPGATFVGGTAVFPLAPGESVTVRENGVPALHIADDWATYQVRWGSRTVRHGLRIDLAPGLIPAAIRCRRRGGGDAVGTVRFDDAGCHISVRGEFPDEPWLADIGVTFGNSPDLGKAIAAPSLPFGQEMPIELYTLLMSPPPR